LKRVNVWNSETVGLQQQQAQQKALFHLAMAGGKCSLILLPLSDLNV